MTYWTYISGGIGISALIVAALLAILRRRDTDPDDDDEEWPTAEELKVKRGW